MKECGQTMHSPNGATVIASLSMPGVRGVAILSVVPAGLAMLVPCL